MTRFWTVCDAFCLAAFAGIFLGYTLFMAYEARKLRKQRRNGDRMDRSARKEINRENEKLRSYYEKKWRKTHDR